MAVAGPERSGSGTGVPVPSSTSFVRVAFSSVGLLDDCLAEAEAATNKTQIHSTKVVLMGSPAKTARLYTCFRRRCGERFHAESRTYTEASLRHCYPKWVADAQPAQLGSIS